MSRAPKARPSPSDQAAAWFDQLSQKQVTTQAIQDFFKWRKKPANAAAYRVLERHWEMTEGRFRGQPDAIGFSVIDSRTGEIAQFANAPMTGITEDDALEVVRVLNSRAVGRRDTFGAH